jgi:hypothetical protein
MTNRAEAANGAGFIEECFSDARVRGREWVSNRFSPGTQNIIIESSKGVVFHVEFDEK